MQSSRHQILEILIEQTFGGGTAFLPPVPFFPVPFLPALAFWTCNDATLDKISYWVRHIGTLLGCLHVWNKFATLQGTKASQGYFVRWIAFNKYRTKADLGWTSFDGDCFAGFTRLRRTPILCHDLFEQTLLSLCAISIYRRHSLLFRRALPETIEG